MLICLMGFFSSCSVTNIYLVRHAEKLDNSVGSALTEQGGRRAMALRDTLLTKNIDSIYATPYNRTQLTAKPLADALKKDIISYQPDAKFSARLKKLKGKNVLVVGHSNTIPEIIRHITTKAIRIDDYDFDNLYIIRIKRFLNLNISLVSETYGERSP